jgi:hypothetical protein
MKVLASLLLFAALAAPAAGAAVSVTNDRTAITTRLGHKFTFHSRIENRGTAPARDLVAHLNVVDLTGHTYVDPEDWSAQRTRYLRAIPAGGSTTVTWPMNAVNAGTIGIYVAVLPRGGTPVRPVTSPTLRLRIRDRRTLNSGGILPLALGIPGALGLVALSVRSSRRRSRTRSPS